VTAATQQQQQQQDEACGRSTALCRTEYLVSQQAARTPAAAAGTRPVEVDTAGLPHTSTAQPPAKHQQQQQHICLRTHAAAAAAATTATPHCWRANSRWQPRPLLLLLLLASAASVLRLPVPAGAQQPMPFQGQGDVPPAAPVDVHVSTYVDRILAVDDRHYEFTVSCLQQPGLLVGRCEHAHAVTDCRAERR
jgi:hypothetical protein